MSESTALEVVQPQQVQAGFGSVEAMIGLQRIAKPFTQSAIVPKEYQGDQNIASTMIALDMSIRMKMNPLMVMQNLHIIHGRPGWSAQFLIASFNTTGRYETIRYRWSGEKGTDSWGCTAYTKELATGETIEGPEITIQMAKKEGWVEKNGSKWKTMPQLMMTYRAAAFLIRTTAPEIAMGLMTAEEILDDTRTQSLGAIVEAPQSEAPKEQAPLKTSGVRAGKSKNRGHGKDNLDAVAQAEPGSVQPAQWEESKPKAEPAVKTYTDEEREAIIEAAGEWGFTIAEIEDYFGNAVMNLEADDLEIVTNWTDLVRSGVRSKEQCLKQ